MLLPLRFTGWVTEGDGGFSELAGSPAPRNIHQEALRGIAKVLTPQQGSLQQHLCHNSCFRAQEPPQMPVLDSDTNAVPAAPANAAQPPRPPTSAAACSWPMRAEHQTEFPMPTHTRLITNLVDLRPLRGNLVQASNSLPSCTRSPYYQVLLERGERAKAKWQYEKILGKALLGRGREDHWAHSEYAWLAFEDGDLQVRGLRVGMAAARTTCLDHLGL